MCPTTESDQRPAPPIKPRQDVTGIVLAGGRARRMGGMDKGLVEIAGSAMIGHVLDRLAPQVAALLINANRNLDAYAGYGFRVVSDRHDDYPGPLAGFAAGMEAARTPFVVTVPCDSPLLSRSLVARLCSVAEDLAADIVVAHDGTRLQPTFALLRRSLADSLESYIDSGGRKIDRWYAGHGMKTADCSDIAASFANVNDPDELAAIARDMMRAG